MRVNFYILLYVLMVFCPVHFVKAEEPATPSAQSDISPTYISEPKKYTPLIVAVEFKGVTIQEQELIRQLDLRLPAPLTVQLIQQSIKRIYEVGNFSEVACYLSEVPRGYKAIFVIEPIRTIVRANVSGNETVSNAEILLTASLNEGDPFTAKKRNEVTAKIVDLYQRRGFENVIVDISAIPLGETQAIVEVFIEEGKATNIGRFVFEGEPKIEKEQLETVVLQKRGDVLNMNLLEESAKRLYEFYRNLGYLEAKIGAKPLIVFDNKGSGSANVIYKITAGPTVDVKLEGNRAVASGRLIKAARLDKTDDFSEAGAARIANLMQKYLYEDGFLSATVESKVRYDSSKQHKEVVFKINEGSRYKIKEIKFEGNKKLTQIKLRELFSQFLSDISQGDSATGPVNPDTADELGFSGVERNESQPFARTNDPLVVFRPTLYEEAVALLQDEYHKRGFLSARIKLRGTEIISTESEIIIAVEIEEGIQTIVEKADISGGMMLGYRFRSKLDDNSGKPFSREESENLRLEMASAYNDEGYIFSRISLITDFNENRSKVRLTYEIIEGPLVHISKVIIKGTKATKEAVVKENLTFGSGDIYHPEAIEESRRNLLKLGIFQNVTIRPAQPELPEEWKPVIVTVEEGNFQAIEPGFGISTEDGVRAFAEYQHLNLFGYSLQFTTRARVSYQVFDFLLDELQAERLRQLPLIDVVERRVDVGLTYPRILYFPTFKGFPYKTSARFNLIHERDNTRAYGLDRNSAVAGLDFELVPQLIFSLQYELEKTYLEILASAEEQNVNLTLQERDVLLLPEGAALFGTFRPSLIYDHRDNVLNPRSGWLAGFATEFVDSYAGDIESSFIKYYGKASFYIPMGRRLGFASNFQAGNIYSTSDTSVDGTKLVSDMSENEKIKDERSRTPLNKRFYLGGRSTLRGFNEKALVPSFGQIPAEKFVDLYGRNAQMQTFGGNTFVLGKFEFRVPLTPAFGVAFFSDVGGLWLRVQDVELSDLRPTAGTGIRFTTPVGPLALDIGFNLDPNLAYQEPKYTIHFSIGTF